MLSEEEDRQIIETALSDPDALPLTDAQLEKMVPIPLLQRWRKDAESKENFTVPLSAAVIRFLDEQGYDWQSRINGILLADAIHLTAKGRVYPPDPLA
jgi:uncharacterized protein (DUF4415 family)